MGWQNDFKPVRLSRVWKQWPWLRHQGWALRYGPFYADVRRVWAVRDFQSMLSSDPLGHDPDRKKLMLVDEEIIQRVDEMSAHIKFCTHG